MGQDERIGSGLMSVYETWREQHWREPELVEEFEPERTTLLLTTLSLLPADTLETLRNRLGWRFEGLDELQRVALVTVELEGSVTHARLREMTNKHPREVTLALFRLVQRGLLQSSGQRRLTSYTWPPSLLGSSKRPQQTPPFEGHEASSELSEASSELSEAERVELERVAAPLRSTRRARRDVAEKILLKLCKGRYLTLDELARLTSRRADSLRIGYLNNMVEDGRLRLRYPDAPTHPRQAYTAAET